jgi:hypothetical protein
LPDAPPTPGAWQLGAELAAESLEPLARALERTGLTAIGEGWRVDAPTELTSETASMGVPLLGSCSTDALYVASRLRQGAELPGFTPLHEDFRVRLARFPSYEALLWDLAAAEGGPSHRVPYAFAFYALEWFWDPEVHALDRIEIPCLRCGRPINPRRPLKLTAAPRCPHCAKESPKARTSPAHALAPDGRGRWWLLCRAEGCSNAFVGRADQLRCPHCRSSRTTPHKRKSLLNEPPPKAPTPPRRSPDDEPRRS